MTHRFLPACTVISWNFTDFGRVDRSSSVRQRTIRLGIVHSGGQAMDSIIYLVGLIVVVMFILSVLGLR